MSSGRFDNVKYDDAAAMQQSGAKTCCIELERYIDHFIPKGRAQSLALTKLEEVYMWIGKAIRDGQVNKIPESEN